MRNTPPGGWACTPGADSRATSTSCTSTAGDSGLQAASSRAACAGGPAPNGLLVRHLQVVDDVLAVGGARLVGDLLLARAAGEGRRVVELPHAVVVALDDVVADLELDREAGAQHVAGRQRGAIRAVEIDDDQAALAPPFIS